MKKKLLTALAAICIGLCYYFDLPFADVFRSIIAESSAAVPTVVDGIEIPLTPKGLSERVLRHTNYTVSFNPDTNIPNWVAWSITSDELIERESRTNNFQPDPALPAHEAVTTEDYTRSGYDRGHMCPAADNRYHWRAMDESFYMTNICPQNHNLNAGVWSSLEQQCRHWANGDTIVHVICGPILYDVLSPRYIGNEHQVRVPDAFFKVVLYGYEQGTPRGIGYIFENKAGKKSLDHYARSIDEVERITGIDFFHLIPDNEEARIER